MYQIINLILTLIILYLLFKFGMRIYKRIFLLHKLNTLKSECNAKITLQSFPFRPMWWKTKKADIKVEILDTVYLISLYSGGGSSKMVHFANLEYSVVYSRLRPMFLLPLRSPVRHYGSSWLLGMNVSYGSHININPRIEPTESQPAKKGIVNVMLFNPAPHEVSYVTPEKTSIKLAFTGDDLYGYKIFTASTFAVYAERAMRDESAKAEASATKHEHEEYEYFFDQA